MFICLWNKKNLNCTLAIDSPLNLRSRTSHRIYRLALRVLASEKLSSLSKSRISIFNAHLTLFVLRMMSHNYIGKCRHLVNRLGTCIVTQGPVSIVGKLYQFQIVQSLSYALFLTTLSLFCPLASSASLTFSFVHRSHV